MLCRQRTLRPRCRLGAGGWRPKVAAHFASYVRRPRGRNCLPSSLQPPASSLQRLADSEALS